MKNVILTLMSLSQEIIFSCKSNKTDHPVVYFNEAPVAKASCQKHLGMHLDEKLNFDTHIKEKSQQGYWNNS